MAQEVLGGFEHQVLLAILRIGEEAYTVPIVAELEARAGRTVAPAAVYVTLRRLERRGLLGSRFEPREGGGRPRRVFRIQPEGIEILRHSKRLLEGLWSGVAALEET